jgi:hypothetical protein
LRNLPSFALSPFNDGLRLKAQLLGVVAGVRTMTIEAKVSANRYNGPVQDRSFGFQASFCRNCSPTRTIQHTKTQIFTSFSQAR